MVCITTLNSILTNRESLLSTYRSFVVTPQSSKSKKKQSHNNNYDYSS